MQKLILGLLACISLNVLGAPLLHGKPLARFIAYTSAWKNGQIEWYYNPSGQPAWLSKETAVATIKQGMQQWSDACNVSFTYKGETSEPAVRKDGTNTLGWGNTLGYPYANAWPNGSGGIIEGDIQFVVSSFSGVNDFASNVIHEVGHLIGLSHSDRPAAVMFANGYNTYGYQSLLKGDDMAACAKLYGGRGLVKQPDFQAVPTQPIDNYKISIEVSRTTPTNTPQPSVASIPPDVKETIYFAVRYDGVPLGEALQLRFVAPDGADYNGTSFITLFPSPSWMGWLQDLSIAPMRNLTGKWEVQILKGERILARQSFVIENAYPNPVVASNAVVLNLNGSGGLQLSARNLQANSTTTRQTWWANARSYGSSANDALNALDVGDYVITYFATSSNPRYANTEASEPDSAIRLLAQLDEDGWPVANRFTADVSGTLAAGTLDANIAMRSTGDKDVYVLMFNADGLFWKTPTGWQTEIAPLLRVSSPAHVAVNVWDRIDLRALPAGTAIYVGFGKDLDEVVARGQYGQVFALP